MSQANRALIARLYEEVDRRNLAVIDQLFSPDYVDHNPPPVPGALPGREGLRQNFEMFLAAFPQATHVLEHVLAEDDCVVVRVTARGVHGGAFMGVPPTGRELSMTGIAIYRIADGRIIEKWGEQDRLGMLVQLGLVSLPQAETAPAG